ncbi:MAG: metallophosphoesterase family protein [Limnochordia bacterium]|nr:metallophosphoesterase family protein [Limnochordia bacterium]
MQEFTKDRRRYLPVLFMFLGLVLFINLFSGADFQLLSLGVNLKIDLGYPAQTRILLPPVGQVGAATHWLPIRLNVELRSVDLELLRIIVFSPTIDSLETLASLKAAARRILMLFILRLVLLGTLGAVVLLYLSGTRRLGKLTQGGLAAALLVMALALLLYASYDLSAFEQLEYEGMLEAAPWVLNLAWDAFGQVEELGKRVQVLASDLYSLLQELESLGPLGLVQADVLVLHVSDIHNNPVAYSFAKQVVDSFPVDLIMDTGDLTDWGTALEMEVTARIEELKIPYLFVTGNHDSPEVLHKLATVKNAVLVGNEEKTVAGLRIAGTGDLVADTYLATPASRREQEAYARELNEAWAQVENRPDVFMAHNHVVAEALEPGLFPVVVYGHTHLWGLRERGATVYSNAGTTGAAGIRGFQGRTPLPYSLSLLYFERDEQGHLRVRAVDGVHVTGLGTSFSLQRTFIDGRNQEEDVELVF